MDMLLVEVFLPAAGKKFVMRLPAAMNSLLAAHMAAEALADLSDGTYRPSRSSIFAKRGSGRILDMNQSLEQNRVINGSQLLLI